mgnify:CR=1 FL=1
MSENNRVISWDQYFMGLAKLSARRSKDPNTQVGACIVNEERKVVGLGYNGMPYGMNDADAPWERVGDVLDTKYAYVVHAELNAILNSTTSLKGCTIYVSLFPCNECAKAIVQSGIRKVIYESDKYNGVDTNIASKRILKDGGVELQQCQTLVDLLIDIRDNAEYQE